MTFPPWFRLPLWGTAALMAAVLLGLSVVDAVRARNDDRLIAQAGAYLARAASYRARVRSLTQEIARLRASSAGHHAAATRAVRAAESAVASLPQATPPDTCLLWTIPLTLAVDSLRSAHREDSLALVASDSAAGRALVGWQAADSLVRDSELLVDRLRKRLHDHRLVVRVQAGTDPARPLEAEARAAVALSLTRGFRLTIERQQPVRLQPVAGGNGGRWLILLGRDWRLF
jgi:hypothetical protein